MVGKALLPAGNGVGSIPPRGKGRTGLRRNHRPAHLARRPSSAAIRLAVLASFMLGLVGLAHAQPADTQQPGHEALLQACNQSLACKIHLDNADQLYQQNAYGAALDEYRAAYGLQPYPLILYNIARIHHKQSHLTDAEAYYQRYLATGHAERQERARQLLSEVRKELGAQTAPSPSTPVPLRPESPPLIGSAPAPKISPQKKPAYKQWWVWTLVGAAAAGAAVGIGVGVYASGPDVSGLPSWTASLGR